VGVLDVAVDLDERGDVAEGDCHHQRGGIGQTVPPQGEDEAVNRRGSEENQEEGGNTAESQDQQTCYKPPI
jgi:hypothetical protein